MGQIDVTALLQDPDFMDVASIVRRFSTVNEYGENCLTENAFSTYACVQPASGDTLKRLPDALQAANVFSFWVKGQIVADYKCKYPDIIIFKGVRYEIQVVFDWTNWGPGYSEGTAVAQKPVQ